MMKIFHNLKSRVSINLFVFISSLILTALFTTGCENSAVVISNVDEREANLIVVFLESKGIKADKMKASSGNEIGGGADTGPKFNISVAESKTIEAMAVLNRNGLPRKQGTNLLSLFAKQGLMSSDKEENIRYQAGLAQQITNTILLIDGVIDATVQLSFPTEESLPGQEQQEKEHITAAVFVKHQGMYDDSSLHLENKIKRIVSGSITGLDINDVTVVSDKSRFTDITMGEIEREMSGSSQDYVSVWNIIVNKSSLGKFRFLFFIIIFFAIVFALLLGWLIWKIYPTLRKGGIKEILKPSPFVESKKQKPEEEPPNPS